MKGNQENALSHSEGYINLINEPGVGYGAGNYQLLSSASDDFTQILAARKGLPKSTLYKVAAAYGVTLEEISHWLHSSYRNLSRKDASDLLDSFKSERMLALAQLANVGIQVLDSLSNFQQWIQTPLLSLGNQAPVHLLDTGFGIQLLENQLHQLEHGIFV